MSLHPNLEPPSSLLSLGSASSLLPSVELLSSLHRRLELPSSCSQGELVFALPGPDQVGLGIDWSGRALALTKLTLAYSMVVAGL